MTETVRFQFNLGEIVGTLDADGLIVGKPFRIFPGGLTRAIDGRRIEFRAAEAEAILAAFSEEVPITLEHETTVKAGEAVGWIVRVEIIDGALWATEVRWTPEGADLIASNRYRYVSGDAFGEFSEDGKAFRPRALAAVSITNKPAIRGMGRVRLEAGDVAPEPGTQKEELSMKKETFALLGIAEDADAEAVHAGLEAKFAAVRAEVEAEREAFAATIRAEAHAAFAAKLAEEKASWDAEAAKTRDAETRAARVAALLEKGVREGKVTAATKASFGLMAEGSLEAAEAFLAAAPRVAPLAAMFSTPEREALPEGLDLETPEGRAAVAERASAYAAEKGLDFVSALAAVVNPPKG